MKRALDLFCGGGGAARGLVEAGYEVVGVDRYESPAYPGEVRVGDAMELRAPDIADFDLVWASPPCQRYSVATPADARAEHADLLGPIQDLLDEVDVPSIVENVPGAPMRRPDGGLVVSLTGPAVGLDLIERRRLFACRGFLPMVPPPRRARRVNGAVSLATKGQFRKVRLEDGSRRTEVPKARAVKSGAVGVETSGPKSNRQRDRPGALRAGEVWLVDRSLKGEGVLRGKALMRACLGIQDDAMSQKELGEAVPPAYAKLLARQV